MSVSVHGGVDAAALAASIDFAAVHATGVEVASFVLAQLHASEPRRAPTRVGRRCALRWRAGPRASCARRLSTRGFLTRRSRPYAPAWFWSSYRLRPTWRPRDRYWTCPRGECSSAATAHWSVRQAQRCGAAAVGCAMAPTRCTTRVPAFSMRSRSKS